MQGLFDFHCLPWAGALCLFCFFCLGTKLTAKQ